MNCETQTANVEQWWLYATKVGAKGKAMEWDGRRELKH